MTLCIAGCHRDQTQLTADNGQNGIQDQNSDPAAANMAQGDANTAVPASYTTTGAGTASGAYGQQPATSSGQGASYDVGPDQDNSDPGYGAQPVAYAEQPPPPLPDYDQPPAPGDGYLWTPGYWGYTQDGYYWVPGAWVQAPYQGALWTPGYWGFRNHRYGFYRGYWGPHIGFYGGVNYGFGYIGFGYQGGYWGGGHFNYNRDVNNVNVSMVHNVYSRTVVQNSGGARVSFNGGSGGLQVRARPAELAARREPHSAPMSAQVQNEHIAGANRAQFVHGSQGRPASLVVGQPLAADRNVRGPAALQEHNQAAAQQRNPAEMHSTSAQPINREEPSRNQTVQSPNNEHPTGHAASNRNEPSRPAPIQQAPHQAAPQRQEIQSRAIATQHQASPERQVTPQRQAEAPQRQVAPQQHRQPAPQQHQAASQQRQAPTAQAKPEEHPKK